MAIKHLSQSVRGFCFFTVLVKKYRERRPIGVFGGYDLESMERLSGFRVANLRAIDYQRIFDAVLLGG